MKTIKTSNLKIKAVIRIQNNPHDNRQSHLNTLMSDLYRLTLSVGHSNYPLVY